MGRARSIATTTLAVLAILSACSPNAAPERTLTGSTSGERGGSSGTLTGGSGAAPGSGGLGAIPGTGGSGGADLGDACAADTFTATAEPIDLYIMLDQSASMDDALPAPASGTLWTAVTSALKNFLNLPEAAGIRVGIAYFGILNGGANLESSCNAADYATPSVPIDLLPGNVTALVDSINQHGPSTFTPTRPALEGALSYATTWAAQNPDRRTVLVLATDGYPTECDTNLNAMRDLAAQAAAGNPRVLTFVIGIGGLSNLNALAESGGTGAAFIISSSPTLEQEFAQAMRDIAATPLACEYSIPAPPPGKVLDPNLVNLRYTAPQTPSEVLINVSGPPDCSQVGNAWYYDNNVSPTRILLCQQTCDNLGLGTFEVLVGCESYKGPK